MPGTTALLPFQPTEMSPAQVAVVSYLACYSGHTHRLYAFQLRRWFTWCEYHRLDPLKGIQRAHIELYIRQLGDSGLMDSSVVTMMHAVRGFFRFVHIDGLVVSDPAHYARLPKVHRDESSTQGLNRLELIRFLQVAQTLTVHHRALAYLLGIKALRASEAAAVRIEDYAETLRGHRVLHWSARATSPPPCQSPSRFYASWKPASASAPPDHSSSNRSHAIRSTAATPTGWSPESRRSPASRTTSARTPCGTPPSPMPSTQASHFETPRSWPAIPPALAEATRSSASWLMSAGRTGNRRHSRAMLVLVHGLHDVMLLVSTAEAVASRRATYTEFLTDPLGSAHRGRLHVQSSLCS